MNHSITGKGNCLQMCN